MASSTVVAAIGLAPVALDVMLREIRAANSVGFYSTNKLSLISPSGQQLSYTWNGASNTVIRTVNGMADSRPLLTSCDKLNFKIYQRSPSNAFGLFDTASNVSLCKLVEVSWVCSRTLFGRKENTESVQTARIVIRKQGT